MPRDQTPVAEPPSLNGESAGRPPGGSVMSTRADDVPNPPAGTSPAVSVGRL
ncbi:Uncharacterised protein [Mycobacteroides abscessus]|nr:Uncharacterised protein [Mycobacteroides abscessus]